MVYRKEFVCHVGHLPRITNSCLPSTGVLSSGVKESTLLNNIFTVVNLVTVSIVIIAGSLKCKFRSIH